MPETFSGKISNAPIFALVPCANMEGAVFMIYTAGSHQVTTGMFWLHFWGAVISAIFIFTVDDCDLWYFPCRLTCWGHWQTPSRQWMSRTWRSWKNSPRILVKKANYNLALTNNYFSLSVHLIDLFLYEVSKIVENVHHRLLSEMLNICIIFEATEKRANIKVLH